MGYSPTMMRWMTQDPDGYVDGMNDFLVFGGNPIDETDPTGLWKLKRDNTKPLAPAEPEKGDTIRDLAKLANLNPDEWQKWLTVSGVDIKNLSLDKPLPEGCKFEVPNEVRIDAGRDWPTFQGFGIFSFFDDSISNESRHLLNDMNYDVVISRNVSDAQLVDHLRGDTANKQLAMYLFYGHGSGGTINTRKEGGVQPGKYTNYGLTEMMLFACESATGSIVPPKWRVDGGPQHTTPPGNNLLWRLNVAPTGMFFGYDASVGISDQGAHQVYLPGLYEPDYPEAK